jgi:hypothetical protein
MSLVEQLSRSAIPYGVRRDGSVCALIGAELIEVTLETDIEELCRRRKNVLADEVAHQVSLDGTMGRLRDRLGREVQGRCA